MTLARGDGRTYVVITKGGRRAKHIGYIQGDFVSRTSRGITRALVFFPSGGTGYFNLSDMLVANALESMVYLTDEINKPWER